MILLVGLGNPGPKYETTRHNFGFLAIDHFADEHRLRLSEKKHKAFFTKCKILNVDVIVAKPQTFMNLSGQAIQQICHFFKIPAKQVVVLHDDVDLEFGDIRLKKKGGHAGHNGVKSAMECLATDEFNRIRIGVGRPNDSLDVADYVLNSFNPEELKALSELFDRSTKLIEKTIADLS